MYPAGLDLHHPYTGKFLKFATKGYPGMTGHPWTLNQMEEAIYQGPRGSELQPAAIKILAEEVAAKENKVQRKVVLWDSIKDNPPDKLKISPIAMIPPKSRLF